MRLASTLLVLVATACGSSPSQTGTIGDCGGIRLTGPGALVPLSGMAYQETANLGAGTSAPGTYEVAIWSGLADAGDASQSEQTNCSRLLAGDFSSSLFIAPRTLEFNLPDHFLAQSYTTVIFDLTQPISESAVALEDILGSVNLGTAAGGTCLSGSFSANLRPVDPASGLPIDAGVIAVNGTFSLPYCH